MGPRSLCGNLDLLDRRGNEGAGKGALPKGHWNGVGLLRSLSQTQLWLQRTLPGRCAGLRSPLFPRAQERLPTWPQQQARETRLRAAAAAALPARGRCPSAASPPGKLPVLAPGAALSPPAPASSRSRLLPTRTCHLVSASLSCLCPRPWGGGALPQEELKADPHPGLWGQSGGAEEGEPEGGCREGRNVHSHQCCLLTPWGGSCSFPVVCCWRVPRGSFGTGEQGNRERDRGQLRKQRGVPSDWGTFTPVATGRGGQPQAPLTEFIPFQQQPPREGKLRHQT